MAFSFRLENGPFHLTLNGPSRPTLTKGKEFENGYNAIHVNV